jgi:hypothetical protein
VFVDNTPDEQATPTPSGTGGGETGTPTPTPPSRTLPPTDALGGQVDTNGDSWRLALIVIAGLLSTILVLTPSRRRR